MSSGEVDLKKPSRLEYIVTGYCIAFFFMGFGFGMVVGNLDFGWYVIIIGMVINGILGWSPKTNMIALRMYRLPESY